MRRLSPPAKYVLWFGAIILFVFTIMRILFYIAYRDRFLGCSSSEISRAFAYGLRFDAATLLMISAPFFLLVLLPWIGRYPITIVTAGVLHMFVIVIAMIWQIIDIQYYPFVNRRISYEVTAVLRDMPAMTGVALKSYPGTLLMACVGSILFMLAWIFIARKIARADSARVSIAREIARLLIFCAIAVIGIRGGLQYKPLRVSLAFQNEKTALGHLSLNAIYTTAQALRKGRVQTLLGFRPTSEDVRLFREIIDETGDYRSAEYPLLRRNAADGRRIARRSNVVILVMESWTPFMMRSYGGEQETTPAFDRLARQGLLCTRFFSSGQRSTDAMPAILGSLPALSDAPILSTSLEQNQYMFITSILKRRGYRSLFLHGGRRGSLGFDGFARMAGFDRHISREDFRLSPEVDDGTWGIWDGPALERLNRELSRMDEPFVSLFFSLSSHAPYHVPSPRYLVFKNDTARHEYLNTLYYSDAALGEFFSSAQKEKYFGNTLFVILADHTEGHFPDVSMYDNYRIPCLFYAPGLIAPGIHDGLATQVDILPSIIDFLNIDAEHASFGRSIFPEDGSRHAALSSPPLVGWVERGYLDVSDGERTIGLFDFEKDRSAAVNLVDREAEITVRNDRRIKNYLKMSYKLLYSNRIAPPPTSN